MLCKNCGTENPDDAEHCSKCKELLPKKRSISYEINLLNIIMGVIVSSILLGISYFVMGDGTVLFGLIIIFVGGFVTGILDKNIYSNSNDISSAVNGGITGFITGIIFAISANLFPTISFLIISGLIFYIILGIAGGGVGGSINYLIKNKILKIAIIIALVLLISIIGYAINQSYIEGKYDTAYRNQVVALAFDDLIQPEADAFLNAKANTTQQKMVNLKEAQTRYQRMKNITNSASLWNNEMANHASSDIEKEYAKALGQYVNLKLNYYSEMEAGIESAINEDDKGAQTRYQNAKNLVSEIQSQEDLLIIITNKDPKFKQYTDQQIAITKKFAEQEKEKSELMTFPIMGPD